ncbi:MAG TPA: LptF/LptG family permease [Phycisphaerae bacterium]|nr:LptF/LptG family permease [Phycisphaerae bacterium]
MKILDRYILRNFLTSAVMWFIVFMAMRTVADLFINMDEFAKLDKPFGALVGHVVTYYSYQLLAYFTELGGVIIVASAAFTLAMMNHTNELTAMLASGVSLHRVVVPIIICSVLLSGLIVLDQELLIPRVADKLVRERDDAMGKNLFQVRLMTDGAGSVWYAHTFRPQERVMDRPVVLLRDRDHRALGRISGRRAEPATADGEPGWAFAEGVLSRMLPSGEPWKGEYCPRWDAVYTRIDPNALLNASGHAAEVDAFDPGYDMTIWADRFDARPRGPGRAPGGTLLRPRFIFRAGDGRVLGAFLARSAVWSYDDHKNGYWALEDGVLFHPSDLTGDELILRRSNRWLQYMSTSQLTRLLQLKRVPDMRSPLLARHVRFTEPLNNLVMLLLGLPFILSRERNIRSSATLCLLMVGTFYLFIYICRHLGLPATWAAWLPILLFGPIAAVMLDSVKT